MSVEKREIRRVLREQRRTLSAAAVDAAGAAAWRLLASFPVYHSTASVLAYIGDENEVPTTRLIDDVIRTSRLLYLPRQSVNGPAVVQWQPGQPLRVGSNGVAEPECSDPASLQSPAMVLLPVVAWSVDGTRLGRGGGFYDRLLAPLSPAIVRVGLAYEFQCVAGLPHDPWDVPLDYVITEQRVIRCGYQHRAEPARLRKGGLQL